MHTFESFVETNYSLASDVAKRKARLLYIQLKNQKDLMSTDVPPLVTRYEDALAGLRASHSAKVNELFEVSFANDRRSEYVSNSTN